MNQFIRFTAKNYELTEQEDCIANDSADESCGVDEEYKIPAKPGDVFKFIINKSDVDYSGAQVSDLRIALTKCGVLVADVIGTIEEGDEQLFISATLPEDLEDADCYQFVIYSIYTPIECGDYAESSLQDVIDDGIILGQVLNCTLNDFL